jgi:hypothetical protein
MLGGFAVTMIPDMPEPRGQSKCVRVRIAYGANVRVVFDSHPQLAITMIEFLDEYGARFGHADRTDNLGPLPNNTCRSITLATG